MVRMVDQLLNLARLRGGRVTLQPRSVELMTLATQYRRRIRGACRRRAHLRLRERRYASAGRRRSALAGVFESDRQRAAARPRRLGDPGAARRQRRRRRDDQRAERGRNSGRRAADDLRAVSLGTSASRNRAAWGSGSTSRTRSRRCTAATCRCTRRVEAGTTFEVTLPRAPRPRPGTRGAGAAVSSELNDGGALRANRRP